MCDLHVPYIFKDSRSAVSLGPGLFCQRLYCLRLCNWSFQMTIAAVTKACGSSWEEEEEEEEEGKQ